MNRLKHVSIRFGYLVKTLLLLIFVVITFQNCAASKNSSGEGNGALGGQCQFTLSGDMSGQYGKNAATSKLSGYNWYNCHGDPNVTTYPEVSIAIKETLFTGPGTYNLYGNGMFLLVATANGVVYRSNNNAFNCQAVFTSESSYTFTCDNVQKEVGGGVISVSNGSAL